MASSRERALKKALKLEQKVLCDSDIDAMIDLGELLLFNKNFASERKRGVQMLERAIKQTEHPLAMTHLAYHLIRNGNSVDHRRAVWLLERSLKLREDSFSLNELAQCYENGIGVATNINVAVQLYERAIRLDKDPVLIFNLAFAMLRTPSYLAQRKHAISLFKKAIRQTSEAEMMNKLGLLYGTGKGNLNQCPKKAMKWYRRAIQTSNYVPSMSNLADLLLKNEPSDQDIEQAVRLLEDAMEEEQERDVNITLQLADTYLLHAVNLERAVRLYESAAIRFNSMRAKSELIGIWVDRLGFGLDHGRIFEFCRDDYDENREFGSRLIMGDMLWTGTNHMQMNRREAMQILDSLLWTGHGSFSLMLRHDLEYHPDGEKRARRLMKKFNNEIDKSYLSEEEVIVVSENECEEDKWLAMESFRAQMDNSVTGVWFGPYLRIGRFKLPFDGRLECVTNPMRRFTRWRNIASLNLANIVLEIEGKQQESVIVLENLMNSELRLIAMLNLAYILMSDIEGVPKNWARGVQLIEDAVKERNDVSARAMLANALAERSDSDDGDVERGWELWHGVESELEADEKELQHVSRLITASSKKKWDILNRQKQE